jgi:signal transduction histidine kinase
MVSVRVLRRASVFEGLSDNQLEAIAGLCRETSYVAGAFICREGDPAEELYIVREGQVALEMALRVWPTERVRQVHIETLGPGDAFGMSRVSEAHTLAMSARAVERSKVIVLRSADLRFVIEQDHEIGYRVASGLASVVAARLDGTRVKLTRSLGEREVAREQAPEEATAIRRVHYGIYLRWGALVVISLAILIAHRFLGVTFPALPVLAMVLVVALYNTAFWRYARRLDSAEPATVMRTVRRYIWAQSIADLFAATVILHFTGGVENPFVLYYVFHVILVAMILPHGHAYALATTAAGLVTSLIGLEYFQIVPHVHLEGFVSPDLYLQPPFVLAVSIGLVAALYGGTYVATSVADELRKQHRQSVVMRDRLLLEALREAEDLQRANEELLRLDRLKTYFLAMASHDLKAPLVAVQSYLQVMLGGFVGQPTPQHRQMMERSSERIRQLFDLINRLLDLSQMEKGKVAEEMRMIALQEVLHYCLEDIRVLAAEKAQNLHQDIPSDLPMVHGSPNHLRELVTNLLSNAVKFTPEGGDITLGARETEEDLEVAVMDTGIGIDPDDLPYLFDEFYRGKRGSKASGSGLGLYIAQKIVEAHDGKIWAESPYDDVESGAKFVFTLPKRQPRELETSGDRRAAEKVATGEAS